MTEVLFYHLQRQPLEAVLPRLLEACLERKWRAVVEVGSEERMDALDAALWTYRDDSFLPHGTERDDAAALQPVVLTTGTGNPNEATVRFFVDGAEAGDVGGYDRAVLIFDGNDPDAVDRARESWKTLRAAGHETTYWQQSDEGRWERKA